MRPKLGLILLISLVIDAAWCQTESFCGTKDFTFYNGNDPQGGWATEQQWNWKGYFLEGTNTPLLVHPTIFQFLYLTVTVHNSSQVIGIGVDPVSSCDIGTISTDSASSARYTYDYPSLSLKVIRDFYVPRQSSWLRIIDSICNQDVTPTNASVRYENEFDDPPSTNGTGFSWVSTTSLSISTNAAMNESPVRPTIIEGLPWEEKRAHSFEIPEIPAGECKAIMTFIGQYNTFEEAYSNATYIDTVPNEILVNINTTDLRNIINWITCKTSIEPPTERFSCPSAYSSPFNVSNDVTAIRVNNNAASITNNQFSSPVINGTNIVTFEISTGRAINCYYDFIVPQDFVISLDISDATPVPTATGGYGGYSFNVTVSSDGLTALVNVTDQRGCTASKGFYIGPPIAVPEEVTPQKGPSRSPGRQVSSAAIHTYPVYASMIILSLVL